MHQTTIDIICKGVSYKVKSIDDKHGYREEVSCSCCKIWFDEDHLYWVDPTTMMLDFDGAPVCRSCYEKWKYSETTTYRKAA